MTVDLKLYEEFPLKGISRGEFVCEYSEDGRIYLLSQTGVYVFTLKGYVTNVFSEFSFKKEYFEPSDFTPGTNVGLDIESFVYNLPRTDFYEIILRPELSSKYTVDNTQPVTPKPISACWSPRGIVGKTDCLLAVETNIYSLEIYVKHILPSGKTKFICIANISKEITEYFKHTWRCVTMSSPVEKLQEFKNRISIVMPTAYCWSHVCEETAGNNYVIIFVGHLDGYITAWKIYGRASNEADESEVKFFGRCKTDLQNITALCWQKTSMSTGALTAGDLKGAVSAISVSKMENEELEFADETLLWEERDYIKVSKINIKEYDNMTYVLVIKNNFLLVFGINSDGLVIDKIVYTPASFPITGLIHYEKNIWNVLTSNGRFTQLTIDCKNNELYAKTENIPLKVDTRKFSTNGIVMSPNRVLFIVAATPVKIRFAVKGKRYITLHFFRNMNLDPFKLLMENKSTSLRDYWDCIDMLRVMSLKEKCFPWVGIDENLNYDSLSLLHLKTLRIIARISESVVSVVPVIRHYHIKPYVLLHYIVDMKLAVKRIKHLLKLRAEGTELSKFQLCSIDLLNFFLKEMIMKNILAKAQMGEKTIDEITEVMAVANELKYPPVPQCFWCGEKIIGSTCLPPHSDSRCAVSLMPILFIPAYRCPFCKCVVHKEIEKEVSVILCPYCDVPMESSYHGKEFEKFIKENKVKIENVDLAFSTSPPDVIPSSCCNDCLKEEMLPEDLEEDAVEDLLTISDSENEDSGYEIVDLYFRTFQNKN